MVAGLGPTLRVYVGDTIAEGEDAEEGLTDTRLVLAHELGHSMHTMPSRKKICSFAYSRFPLRLAPRLPQAPEGCRRVTSLFRALGRTSFLGVLLRVYGQ